MSVILFCHSNEGIFPEFLRVCDTAKGTVEITLSEQGLLSGVAKINMPKREAAEMFRAAADAIEKEVQ